MGRSSLAAVLALLLATLWLLPLPQFAAHAQVALPHVKQVAAGACSGLVRRDTSGKSSTVFGMER